MSASAWIGMAAAPLVKGRVVYSIVDSACQACDVMVSKLLNYVAGPRIDGTVLPVVQSAFLHLFVCSLHHPSTVPSGTLPQPTAVLTLCCIAFTLPWCVVHNP